MPLFFRLGSGKALLWVGGVFVLFGILVALDPQILVFLISGFFILVGGTLFAVGLTLYQAAKRRGGGKAFVEERTWKL